MGSGEIKIAVPSDMGDIIPVLTDAKTFWQNGTGRVIRVVLGATCAVNDGLCIELFENYAGSSCAQTFPGPWNGSTGQWIGPPTIRIKPAWRTAHPSVVILILTHGYATILVLTIGWLPAAAVAIP